MPNYIFAKAATHVNPYLERTVFISKSTTDFAMQNPFKVVNTQEETSGTKKFSDIYFERIM